MEIVVQKYGGTSLGQADRINRVAGIVKNARDAGQRPVTVLSAMSGANKENGTTSLLMRAANEAVTRQNYYKTVNQIEQYHLDIADQIVKEGNIKQALLKDIKTEIWKLRHFLDAIKVIEEISPRSMDVIISVGEKLSARIFSGLLNELGLKAIYISLENLVDKTFKEIGRAFYARFQDRARNIIDKLGDNIPVITGYFGFAPNGIIKSIGRGYTDFTASLIARAVRAAELQIWKEVDGVFTADPNKVSSAKLLNIISPEEASELTYFGSEVIHPFTLEQVIGANIPVRIKNIFKPDSPGSIIDPLAKLDSSAKGPTAVTVKNDVAIINIQSNRMFMAYGFMAKVFDIFNKYEVVIDLVSTSEVNVSLTVDNMENASLALDELKHLGEVSVKEGASILSLIGNGMRNTIGTSGRMFECLAKEGVNIEMISQGASEINISCAINGKDSLKALKAVHKMLETD